LYKRTVTREEHTMTTTTATTIAPKVQTVGRITVNEAKGERWNWAAEQVIDGEAIPIAEGAASCYSGARKLMADAVSRIARDIGMRLGSFTESEDQTFTFEILEEHATPNCRCCNSRTEETDS
jgi:hypothetical protein